MPSDAVPVLPTNGPPPVAETFTQMPCRFPPPAAAVTLPEIEPGVIAPAGPADVSRTPKDMVASTNAPATTARPRGAIDTDLPPRLYMSSLTFPADDSAISQ